jgi:nitroreductase
MALDLTIDELLTTTRAVRKRLDLSKPVTREVVEECAALAFQAPNGSNQQRWGWVCVDDPVLKRAMADLYRQGMTDHSQRDRTGEEPVDYSSDAAVRMSASVMHLAQNLEQVPVLLVPTIAGRLDSASIFMQASRWGSILPAVWSFVLALRSRGLGSAWTTIHLYREREMAELLGIPYDEVTQAGLFPVAYTIGSQFKPADRASSRVKWNSW